MRLVAFRGISAYEAQIGPLWIKLLRPRFWCHRNIPNLIRAGIDRSDR
jgi:hypothetical protein